MSPASPPGPSRAERENAGRPRRRARGARAGRGRLGGLIASRLARTLALGLTLGLAACGQALLTTDSAKIPAYVGANGKLGKPAGSGPFPAVVIMHGCGGPPGHQEWIGRLNDWGYATYYIDSFGPRHLKNVCAEQQFKGVERVGDAYAALAYLRARSDTRADRIGLIGFSHGAAAAAYTARADSASKAGMPPFAAAVAFYGGCRSEKFELATDLLVLTGEAD